MNNLRDERGRVIIRGWKNIANAMGDLDRQTARKLAIKYEMPIVPLNGQPSISVLEMTIWWTRLLTRQLHPELIEKKQ